MNSIRGQSEFRFFCRGAARGSWLNELEISVTIRRASEDGTGILAAHETHLLEREWHPRRVEKRLRRFHRCRETGHRLFAGNEGVAGRCHRPRIARALHIVLERRAEEGLRGNCHLHKAEAARGDIRRRSRRSRQRRARHHRGVCRFFPRERVCAKLETGADAAAVSPAVGPRFSRVPEEARTHEAGDFFAAT